MTNLKEIVKALLSFGGDLLAGIISDKAILGPYLRQQQAAQTQTGAQATQAPPTGTQPAGPPPAAPTQVHRRPGGIGYDDEVAVLLALPGLKPAEARKIADWYQSLKRFQKKHCKAVLSTLRTDQDRIKVLRAFAFFNFDDMSEIAEVFQLIRKNPSMADHIEEWLHKNLNVPKIASDISNSKVVARATNRLNRRGGQIRKRTRARIADRRPVPINPHPARYDWDPKEWRLNHGHTRRFIRAITGI